MKNESVFPDPRPFNTHSVPRKRDRGPDTHTHREKLIARVFSAASSVPRLLPLFHREGEGRSFQRTGLCTRLSAPTVLAPVPRSLIFRPTMETGTQPRGWPKCRSFHGVALIPIPTTLSEKTPMGSYLESEREREREGESSLSTIKGDHTRQLWKKRALVCWLHLLMRRSTTRRWLELLSRVWAHVSCDFCGARWKTNCRDSLRVEIEREIEFCEGRLRQLSRRTSSVASVASSVGCTSSKQSVWKGKSKFSVCIDRAFQTDDSNFVQTS